MKRGKRYMLCVFISALLIGLGTSGMAASITITGTIVGESEMSIGAGEGCSHWNINDFVDLGATNCRFYAGMSRLEPEDDDGIYGSPTIAEIKADPNIIPWNTWDYWFKTASTYHWSCPNADPTLTFYDQLLDCSDNGVTPIIVLRPVDNDDNPPWARELNPPDTPEDWNEWWEFCFAWVYYANVLNNLEIHDWQVHNEPDNMHQGWDGTLADYIVLTQYTADAIQYVYDTYLPGESFRLYAPVATHANAWVPESIIANDSIIDVVDWHVYGHHPADEAETIHGWIDQYDSDGVHELVSLSEWGNLRRRGYDSVANALKFGEELMSHSNLFAYPNSKVDMSTIFSMYNWGGGMQGIVMGVDTEVPVRTETWYVMRLLIRGLQGGKDIYDQISDYSDKVVNTKAADGTLYVILKAGTKAADITLDVSAHVSSGTATFYEFSANYQDEIIGTADFSNGIITFSIPKNSFTLVKIPT